MNPAIPKGKILIQFDGICILCSKAVRLILRADRKKKFLFQAIQNTEEKPDYETIRVIHNQETFVYFDAVLKIGKELGGIYRMVAIFRILPRSLRKSIYSAIARNRFRWFGKRESCYFPSEEETQQFI
jgi:predicted DCC family thiol-disulfide oxidoreductase YuxK